MERGKRKMKNVNKIFSSRFWWLWLVIILLGINYLASVFHFRFDLTKEKRYTLSKATKEMLRNLDDDVSIDVFLKGDFPAGFKKLANSTNDFLQLLKDLNTSRIHYRFISPKEEMPGATGIKFGDTLVSLGVNPINLTVQLKEGQQNYVFPVAWIHYKGKNQLVNLYSGSNRIISQDEINNAEALLEYQFLSAFDKIKTKERPIVVYATGNGEPVDYRTADLQQVLLKDYRFAMFDLTRQPFISNDINAMIIVKPSSQFTEEEKFKLDQYVMHGGKLLCFIDNLFAEADSLSFKPQTIAYDRNLNLTDLFFHYGVRINTDLVMDLQCESIPFVVNGNSNNPQQEFLRWNYYPLFGSEGNHAINKDIGLVGGRFVNSMDTIKAEGIRKSILLSSSSNSRTIGTPALISLNENRNSPQDEKFNRADIPVAILLEGKFSSLYRYNVSSRMNDSLAKYDIPYVTSSQNTKIIIAADGDMVLNELVPGEGPGSQPIPLPMGWNKYTYLAYEEQTPDGKYFIPVANREFFQNCLEYLVQNPDIIATRNKNIVLRLLDSKKIKEKRITIQFINIVAPVLLVIFFAFIYQFIRKRKYVKDARTETP